MTTILTPAWTVLTRERDGRPVHYCDADCAAAEPDPELRAIAPHKADFDLLLLDSSRSHCRACGRRLA